jgi:ABC-type sugar transport system substrate-binding protein
LGFGSADAAAQLNVNATMLLLPRDDDLAARLSDLESALLKNPDGIIVKG